MIILVAGQRQAETFYRVGDETMGAIIVDPVKGLQHRLHVVAGEVGHQGVQGHVVVGIKECLETSGAFQVVPQVLAPRGAALEGEGGIKLVRAVVDPLAQGLASGAFERRLQALAVF